MENSATPYTADQWSADLAAHLSAEGRWSNHWIAQPGAPTEPRSVAYLIGPADDERLRLTLLHDSNGTPTGKLKIQADLAALEEYSPPGTHHRLSATYPATEPEQIAAAVRENIVPALRQALIARREKRNQIAAAEDKRATILREITHRLPMSRDPRSRTDTAFFGRSNGHIIGGVTAYRNEVAFDLCVSYSEALELAEYIAERRKQLDDYDDEPDDHDDYVGPPF
ncbi:hypothetical protein [Nocardia carnea]|uniref:hypothetical protein n=1 Tax=Nocardia carnea TaxID=37328 RepID=UPI00031C386C|nr:hypothetical protein [Nocardia carnea]